MNVLEKLKSLSQTVPVPSKLPTEANVKNAEEKLGVKFPPSYINYQLRYSDISFRHLEMYSLFEDGSYLDLVQGVKEARQYEGLEGHLLPFVQDNGDYFCFDLKSDGPEYEVVYWSHNGTTNERWENFLDWVEQCWIKEGLENGGKCLNRDYINEMNANEISNRNRKLFAIIDNEQLHNYNVE